MNAVEQKADRVIALMNRWVFVDVEDPLALVDDGSRKFRQPDSGSVDNAEQSVGAALRSFQLSRFSYRSAEPTQTRQCSVWCLLRLAWPCRPRWPPSPLLHRPMTRSPMFPSFRRQAARPGGLSTGVNSRGTLGILALCVSSALSFRATCPLAATSPLGTLFLLLLLCRYRGSGSTHHPNSFKPSANPRDDPLPCLAGQSDPLLDVRVQLIEVG